jgi:uncharacterized repeat protein (TIGR03803 family)
MVGAMDVIPKAGCCKAQMDGCMGRPPLELSEAGRSFESVPSGGLTTIRQFGDGTSGYSPRGELIESSAGVFYGTTYNGGSNDDGVVYRMTLCAADVSAVVAVASQGPLKLNRKTGRYTQTVTLKNGDGAMAGRSH